MRNSLKLGVFAALCASVAFIGCSDDDDDGDGTSGSGGGGAMNKAGSSGSAGKANGGSSSGTGGKANGGSGGATAGTAGVGGKATGGTAGSGGSGGSNAGSGGSNAGSDAGGAPVGGEGGAPSEGGAGGAGECVEEEIGGAGGVDSGAGGESGYQTAIVLVDNIIVKDGATTETSWLFENGADIADSTANNVGGKWLRPDFGFVPPNITLEAGSHNVFAKCDGNPAGSMKLVIPFTGAAEYFEVHNGFAAGTWDDYTVTADVMLVSGGAPEANCPGHAELFINGSVGGGKGPSKLLKQGEWVALGLTAPAAATIDRIGVRVTTYACAP